tara:strand:+ start:1324 stop:1494 length:171 start_codon:yes stop_codon:yes gene_type:complete
MVVERERDVESPANHVESPLKPNANVESPVKPNANVENPENNSLTLSVKLIESMYI